jgi:hypothetical protein
VQQTHKKILAHLGVAAAAALSAEALLHHCDGSSFINGVCLYTISCYLGSLDTSYIIFRNVEFFKFFLTKNLSRKIYGSFSNILFAEMKISKLINYSTDLYQT